MKLITAIGATISLFAAWFVLAANPGAQLPPLDPLQATLGVSNASFVAQTADWVPAHLYATIEAAYDHPGFSFVRILQRCPVWTPDIFQEAAQRLEEKGLLVVDNGLAQQWQKSFETRGGAKREQMKKELELTPEEWQLIARLRNQVY